MSLTPENKKRIVRRSIYAALLIICAVVQNTPGALPEPFGARQLGVVVMVVCISMCERELYGLLFGLLAGVALDVTGGTQGISAIILTVTGYVCGLLVSKLIRNNIFTAMLFCVAALLIYCTVYWLVFVVISGAQGAAQVFLTFYLPSAAYTLIFMPLWFWLVRFVFRRFPAEIVR